MGILLLILKIIGIVLLCILLLVLLLVLLLLFAPFRYRLQAEKNDRLLVKARVRWVFPLAQLNVNYEEGVFITARVFGIPIFRKVPEKKPEGDSEEEETEDPYAVDENGDLLHPEVLSETGKPGEKTEAPENTDTAVAGKISEGDASDAPEQPADPASVKEADGKPPEEEPNITDPEPEKNAVSSAGSSGRPEDGGTKDGAEGKAPEPSMAEPGKSPEEPEQSKERFAFIRRLKEKAVSLKDAAEALFSLLSGKKEVLLRYLKKERTKRVGKLLLKYLKKVLLHIMPKKLSGNLVYGGKDPELTGHAAAVMGMLYILYGENFRFEPDFEEEKLEGSVTLSGRIRLGTLIFYVLKVWFNKDFKKSREEAFRVKDKLAAFPGEAKTILSGMS